MRPSIWTGPGLGPSEKEPCNRSIVAHSGLAVKCGHALHPLAIPHRRRRSQRMTDLTEQPLSREGATEPFDGVREIAWSPDGRLLALGLSCNCPSPWSGVGIVDLVRKQTHLLVDGGHSISWSPDGRWIAFQNAAGDWTGGLTLDFYGVAPGTGEITNLTQSNPGWDPLRPAEESYRDADYQTTSLRWGTGVGRRVVGDRCSGRRSQPRAALATGKLIEGS